ncbi:MAG: DMT family transporter [Bacillota bacterium]
MGLRAWQADLLLLAVTAVWGATFPMVRAATTPPEGIPTFAFLSLRFDLAALVLGLLTCRRLARSGLRTWAAGAVIGLILFSAYALQTLGLGMTTAAKAGFITGLSVVLVPVVSLLWLRRPPAPGAWAGVFLAFGGLALMSLDGSSLIPGPGDLLVLGCAVGFALHIAAVARWAGPHDPAALATIQVAVAALASHLLAAATGAWPGWGAIGGQVWQAVVITGLFATAGAFWLQNTLQPYTTPTHTALIFSAEPIWAALFAWWLAGETLTPRGYLGGSLILAGMLLAELPGLRLPGRRAAAAGDRPAQEGAQAGAREGGRTTAQERGRAAAR